MDWETRLIQLSCDVGEQYQSHWWRDGERISNTSTPDFTDEEVLTISLFGILRKRHKIIEMYASVQDHVSPWVPKLPSYGGDVQRLNKLSRVFPALLNAIAPKWSGLSRGGLVFLLDAMPILLAQGRRRFQAKVAREIADGG
jgi:hypothetical protein